MALWPAQLAFRTRLSLLLCRITPWGNIRICSPLERRRRCRIWSLPGHVPLTGPISESFKVIAFDKPPVKVSRHTTSVVHAETPHFAQLVWKTYCRVKTFRLIFVLRNDMFRRGGTPLNFADLHELLRLELVRRIEPELSLELVWHGRLDFVRPISQTS